MLEISDRVTVFRNGQKVITEDTKNLTKDLVISHMIGRGSKGMHMGEDAELKGDDAKPVVLSVEGVSDGRNLRDFSIELRAGEITGVYGFMGSRPDRTGARAVRQGAAAARQPEARRQAGAASAPPRRRARAGIAFVPENRRMMLFRTEPVYKNVSIAILGRIHRLLVKPQRGEAASPRRTSRTCRSGRRAPPLRWARCRAATSRRWRWPSG